MSIPHRLRLDLSQRAERAALFAFLIVALSFLAACGGGFSSGSAPSGGSPGSGGGGNGGGGGGGGSASAPSISSITPPREMVGVPLGLVNVFGVGFAADAQVYMNGVPAMQTIYTSSTQLQASISIVLDETASVQQVTVHQSSGVSNGVPFTVYAPVLGPQPFNAMTIYFPSCRNGRDGRCERRRIRRRDHVGALHQ